AVTALGARCEVRRADLRSRAGLAKLFRLFRRPGLSVLVNNAGIHCPGLPLEKVSGPAVDELIQVDFAAPVKLAARAYAAFAARGRGAIININSVCALEAHPRRAVYSAAKWGLRGFSAALRREAEGTGVRIADVYLSRVMTRPEFTHGQRADETARRIYSFFSRSRGERLVLDGRPRGRAR
ncbi:MAG: short-chain dehydrogenase/reductase SDR, partial [Elusimicrobia bacterium]